MIFNYKLSAKENLQKRFVLITKFFVKKKAILVALMLCLLLFLAFNLATGIIVGIAWFLGSWFYALWKEISSLNITGRIQDISYEDLVEDLERGYGSYIDQK